MESTIGPGDDPFPFVPLTNSTVPVPFHGSWAGQVALVCSIGSVVGSFLIIWTYLAFQEIRTTSRQILAYLSLANLLSSLCIVWGISADLSQNSKSIGCQVQSVLLIATGIADFMWNIGLALYLFVIITREGSSWGKGGCPWSLYVACWLPGILVALVTYVMGETGVDTSAINTAKWCIVRGPSKTDLHYMREYVLWSMAVGDGWNIVAMAMTFVLYIATKRHIYKETHHEQTTFLTRGVLNAANQIDRKLTFIPLAYFLLHVWSFLRTFIALSRHNINTDVTTLWFKILLGLQAVGDCSEGWANAVIFLVFSPKLRQRMALAMRSKCFYVLYMCRMKCAGGLRHADDVGLEKAARGTYSQGAVNDTHHPLSPTEASMASQNHGNQWGYGGRVSPNLVSSSAPSPYSMSNNATSDTERRPMLPSR